MHCVCLLLFFLFSGVIITCPTICIFACSLYAVWYTKQSPHFFPNCIKRSSLPNYPFSSWFSNEIKIQEWKIAILTSWLFSLFTAIQVLQKALPQATRLITSTFLGITPKTLRVLDYPNNKPFVPKRRCLTEPAFQESP